MNFKNFLFTVLFMGLSMPILGMKATLTDLEDRLFQAALDDDVQEVEELLAEGANPNIRVLGDDSLLMDIARLGDYYFEPRDAYIPTIRLLLANGVDLRSATRTGNTDLMLASWEKRRDIVWLMLTIIPLDQRKKILGIAGPLRARMKAMAITLQKEAPVVILQKDIRKMMIDWLFAAEIQDLVNEQMNRIRDLINMRNKYNETASGSLRLPVSDDIVQLLDLDNPETYQKIRAEVRKNVIDIIFGMQV